MSTEEESGIPPGAAFCGYCEKLVAAEDNSHDCLEDARLDAGRKVRDWLGMRAVGGLYNLAMGVGELMGMDDAALRRIVEAGE